jgi:cytoskeleton protein RodZ
MTELPGADAALAATPGATLAAAREANGLSIAQVAEQMRISPRQVAAIESGRYAELPGAVFVRGFIRNYARLLKLDPVPLLHALEPELGAEAPLRAHEIAGTLPETARRSHPRWWLGAAVVLAVLAAAAAVYEIWRARAGADAQAQPEAIGAAPAAPQAPVGAASSQAPIALAPERLTDAPAGGGGSALPRNGEASGGLEQAPPPSPADEGPIVKAPGQARIEVQFEHESWLELRDVDGNVQYSGTGAAGSTRSFDVKPPVGVVVGNARGVRITYNGRPFDVASHAARNIARFTLE